MTASTDVLDSSKAMRLPPLLIALAVAAGVTLALGAHMAFFYAPTEKVMGFVQKIFYFHVPAAWVMLLSAPLMAVGSIGYLITKRDKWDWLADSAVELAIVFGLMVVISGPLWGRKAWGVLWAWDVRLTSSLVMILTLVACKIVRGYAGPNAKQIAAGLAVFAVLNAIFVYVSVDIWRGTHPPKLIAKGGLAKEMKQTLWLCVLGFTLAYSALLWARLRLARLRSILDALHMRMTQAGLEG
jgi:heme exporter protein C